MSWSYFSEAERDNNDCGCITRYRTYHICWHSGCGRCGAPDDCYCPDDTFSDDNSNRIVHADERN